MDVLIVEPDAELAAFLGQALERDEHRSTHETTLTAASDRVRNAPVDVAIVAAAPGDAHLAWCQAVRGDGLTVPILILSPSSTVNRRIAALDAGADDVLPAPFAMAELRARVRALGRRLPAARVGEVTHGDVKIQLGARRAWVGADEVSLTAREWSIVEFIVQRRGHLVPRTELLGSVWGEVSDASQASLDVLIGRVRKKLGGDFIRTLRGEGFVLR